MKLLITVVAALFAFSVFAQAPAPKADVNAKKVEKRDVVGKMEAPEATKAAVAKEKVKKAEKATEKGMKKKRVKTNKVEVGGKKGPKMEEQVEKAKAKEAVPAKK